LIAIGTICGNSKKIKRISQTTVRKILTALCAIQQRTVEKDGKAKHVQIQEKLKRRYHWISRDNICSQQIWKQLGTRESQTQRRIGNYWNGGIETHHYIDGSRTVTTNDQLQDKQKVRRQKRNRDLKM
jgi:hypothetical protein